MNDCKCYMGVIGNKELAWYRVDKIKKGFENKESLKDLVLDSVPGVYLYKWDTPFGRFEDCCELIYVGKTNKSNGLRKRIKDHTLYRGYKDKWVVSMWKKKESGLQAAWIVLNDKQVRGVERKILEYYREKHHELPPGNNSMPRKQ